MSNIINKSVLFSGLGPETISAIDKISKSIHLNNGGILFTEDDPASELYILSTGSVDLIKSTPDGKEQLIRRVEPGEAFAEAAVFSGELYPVTAMASSVSTLISISRQNFLNLIKTDPNVSLKMMGTMAKLLRHLNSLVGELALGSVASRLAAYLVKRSTKEGSAEFKLNMKKQDLAFQLGTIRETLSRNLSNFKRLGLIDVKGNVIFIKNIRALKGQIK
jgi:CRP/FNR family transcriptional regulator